MCPTAAGVKRRVRKEGNHNKRRPDRRHASSSFTPRRPSLRLASIHLLSQTQHADTRNSVGATPLDVGFPGRIRPRHSRSFLVRSRHCRCRTADNGLGGRGDAVVAFVGRKAGMYRRRATLLSDLDRGQRSQVPVEQLNWPSARQIEENSLKTLSPRPTMSSASASRGTERTTPPVRRGSRQHAEPLTEPSTSSCTRESRRLPSHLLDRYVRLPRRLQTTNRPARKTNAGGGRYLVLLPSTFHSGILTCARPLSLNLMLLPSSLYSYMSWHLLALGLTSATYTTLTLTLQTCGCRHDDDQRRLWLTTNEDLPEVDRYLTAGRPVASHEQARRRCQPMKTRRAVSPTRVTCSSVTSSITITSQPQRPGRFITDARQRVYAG